METPYASGCLRKIASITTCSVCLRVVMVIVSYVLCIVVLISGFQVFRFDMYLPIYRTNRGPSIFQLLENIGGRTSLVSSPVLSGAISANLAEFGDRWVSVKRAR